MCQTQGLSLLTAWISSGLNQTEFSINYVNVRNMRVMKKLEDEKSALAVQYGGGLEPHEEHEECEF